MSTAPDVALSFRVAEPPGGWLLEDEDVPETPLHDQIIELLVMLLRPKAAERGAFVARNLGCRWNPSDARVGTDPDVVWIEPAPPEGEELVTLRVWEPGHAAPKVAVEVVSDHGPEKDYLEAPMRGARLGTQELWVFDPRRQGPSITGGPFLLQIWTREEDAGVTAARMTRVYEGDGPAFSPALGAWLHVTDDGRRLRVAHDEAGTQPWLTPAEQERQRAEDERQRAEHERQRADELQSQADAYAAKLRAMGIDLDG